MHVPFLNLDLQHQPGLDAILQDIAAVIASGAFVNGPAVREFEEAFASYCGTEECIGLASGLDALRLALIAFGVGPGDEVVVPANTFIATFEAVSQTGARPVPVDAHELDWNIDPAALDEAVGRRTAAILPVHLYGQLANMRAVIDIAGRHGLPILEDAAQAHGAERDGLRAGAASTIGAFSFYPGKNLGAMGDAGAATTDDAAFAKTIRALREHGQTRKYEHVRIGWTARLDTIQAVALVRKLRSLDRWNAQRAAIASAYSERLAGVGDLRLLPVPDGSSPVWHLYPVLTDKPAELADALQAAGIGTGRHYPEPPHLSAAYRDLGHAAGAFPVAERIAREEVSLPIFPGMTDAQVDLVVTTINGYFSRG
jgi:dTDP-4-amino-4,6-dideoxygalactose transaminase